MEVYVLERRQVRSKIHPERRAWEVLIPSPRAQGRGEGLSGYSSLMRMFRQRHLAPAGQAPLPPWTSTAIEPSVPMAASSFSRSYCGCLKVSPSHSAIFTSLIHVVTFGYLPVQRTFTLFHSSIFQALVNCSPVA